ncbi:MAG: cyclic dehypoxanthinyl futalosine synthase [Bacillota bacterium]|nr:cyclic dehypoxanthinyl futalosine synthase [Bacillota bacterium]
MVKIHAVLEKALSGGRLDEAEGTALLASDEVLLVGRAADTIRRRRHPEGLVTFVIDRNINYTNVCVSRCRFCAFYRSAGEREAFVLDYGQILAKVRELVDLGGTQVLIQGGLHPDLPLDYYLDMLRAIKREFPQVQVHSFSPPEIVHFSRRFGYTVRDMLVLLREAGLDSLPGGGAEILVDRVRREISPAKIGWREWMDVMRQAHALGMRTTATMMFGAVETLEERVRHMIRLRDLQDETGGFTAFIPWSFQPSNTHLGGSGSTALDYLKTLAVARLVLDNFDNLQCSWVTQGPKVAQVALTFGANDFGSTMLEENVVRAAGACHRVPLEEMLHVIRDAGFTPAQRATDYTVLRTWD